MMSIMKPSTTMAYPLHDNGLPSVFWFVVQRWRCLWSWDDVISMLQSRNSRRVEVSALTMGVTCLINMLGVSVGGMNHWRCIEEPIALEFKPFFESLEGLPDWHWRLLLPSLHWNHLAGNPQWPSSLLFKNEGVKFYSQCWGWCHDDAIFLTWVLS